MLSLDDDEDLIAERLLGSVEPEPRRRVNLRPLLTGLLVLVLGGGLGAGAYLASTMDTRDLIALLDIGDRPRLSLEMPGRNNRGDTTPPVVSGTGPLLTPPGAPGENDTPALVPPQTGHTEGEGHETPPQPAAPVETPPPPVIAPPVPSGPVATTSPPVVPAAPAAATQPLPAAGYQAPSYASLPDPATKAQPLPPAPIEELLRRSAYGPLPVVSRGGQTAFQAYARPFEMKPGKIRMAVVVAGLGLDKDATEAAIDKLPPEVTLAFSPYAGALDKWVKRARDAGHEVMVMVPAESEGFPSRDPGPWGLLVGNPAEENITRLEQVLARVPGAFGALAPGGAFVRSPKLAPVLTALRERGLAFAGEGAKLDVDLPRAEVIATIDHDLFRDAIESRLNAAADIARKNGRGLLVVTPRPVAFDRLLGWFGRMGEQGLVLAPASAVVTLNGKS